MKFLVVSTNTKDVTPYLAEEFARVNELRASGVITAGWIKADYSGAAFIFEGADALEVQQTLETMPIRKNDATDVTVTPVVDLDEVQQSI